MIELAKHRFAINQDDSPAIAPIASIVGVTVENPATPAVRREAEQEWAQNARPACHDGIGTPLPAAEETAACFIVRDHSGQALAYVYFEDDLGRPIPTN